MVEEFLTYAEGSPAGQDTNNDTAWAANSNTGPAPSGSVAKAVSMFNVVDVVGNVWDYLGDHSDWGDTLRKDATVVNVGQDASIPRGMVDHAEWRCLELWRRGRLSLPALRLKALVYQRNCWFAWRL